MSQTNPSDAPISVVVPARNEAPTIGRVVETLIAMPMIDEVVVVDNGSTDDTFAEATKAGARVVNEDRPGMGHAIRAGFIAARNNWVMKVDADLDKFNIALFSRMIEARAPGLGLIKGMWQDPNDTMPMTRYLVMPALRLMFPGLGNLKAPNSGIYAFDRSLIALPEIVGDYAADLDVMLRVYAAGAEVTEVDIGRIENNPRDPSHYSTMSDTIMAFFLRQRDLKIRDEIVVVADHAEQVAGGCLGMAISHLRAGGRVSVFLQDTKTISAQILQEALQPFPTARVGSFAKVEDFRPATTASGMRVIMADTAQDQDTLSGFKQMLLEQCSGLESTLCLSMLDGLKDRAGQADMCFDISTDVQAKADVLQKLGLPSQSLSNSERFGIRLL